MNDLTHIPAAILGTPAPGGFLGPQIRIDGRVYNIIVASKALGHRVDVAWSRKLKRVDGARSFFDGLANTRAMAEAGSEIAKWALDLRIDGCDDFYIPSRDEKEVLYRHFKPTTDDNWVYRNGDNPSSVPPGYPYTEKFPTQTAIDLFRVGGPEAFEPAPYLTSTQSEGGGAYAWIQTFSGGTQYYGHEDDHCRARAVRRVPI